MPGPQDTLRQLPAAILGKPLDPWSTFGNEYDAVKGALYGWPNSWSSENYGLYASVGNILNSLNGGKVLGAGRNESLRFLLEEFFPRHRTIGHGGKEFESGIYLHYFIEFILTARYLGQKLKIPELVNECDWWLRSCMFRSALFSVEAEPRGWIGMEWRGPGVLECRQSTPSRYYGAYAEAGCGFRSHEWDLPGLAVQNFSGNYLSEIIGRPDSKGVPAEFYPRNAVTKALADPIVDAFDWPFNMNERLQMREATRFRLDSMRWILSQPEISTQVVYKPYELLVTDGGKMTVLREFGSSSTQPTEGKRVDLDGSVYVLSCGSGVRMPPHVGASTAELDFTARKLRARRTDGQSKVELDFPPGEVLFHVEFGQHGAREGITLQVTPPSPTEDTVTISAETIHAETKGCVLSMVDRIRQRLSEFV